MKTIFRISLFTALLLLASTRCYAVMRIMHVSTDQAREMGIQVRSTPNGTDDVMVELEFKTEGRLKNFNYVSMEIRDGEKMLLGYAPMKETKKLNHGTQVVSFLINRSFVEKVTLSIVAGFPSNLLGHELRLKEFVDLKNVR